MCFVIAFTVATTFISADLAFTFRRGYDMQLFFGSVHCTPMVVEFK